MFDKLIPYIILFVALVILTCMVLSTGVGTKQKGSK